MAKSPRKDIPFKGFIQLELSEADYSKIEAVETDVLVIWPQVEAMLRSGYNLSLKYDPENKTVRASAQDVREERTSFGWMLSGEASAPLPALAVLTYKHVARMDAQWTPFLASQGETKRYR